MMARWNLQSWRIGRGCLAVLCVLLALSWSDAQQSRFAALADESVAAQKAIEASDTLPFEEWRQHYMAAQGLG